MTADRITRVLAQTVFRMNMSFAQKIAKRADIT